MSSEKDKLVLDKISNIEKEVRKTVIHKDVKDIVGEVVKNSFYTNIGTFMYAITEYESGSFFGIKVAQCSGSMGVGEIGVFDLMSNAKDHADTGFSGQVDCLTELYMTIGVLSLEDRNFILKNYEVLLIRARVELRIDRIQFAISEAVKKEDFIKAAKLNKELNELK